MRLSNKISNSCNIDSSLREEMRVKYYYSIRNLGIDIFLTPMLSGNNASLRSLFNVI